MDDRHLLFCTLRYLEVSSSTHKFLYILIFFKKSLLYNKKNLNPRRGDCSLSPTYVRLVANTHYFFVKMLSRSNIIEFIII